MLGIIWALSTALAWAGSSTILKFLAGRIDTLSLTAVRLWLVSSCLLAFVFVSGRGGQLIHTPLQPFLYVIASGVIALVVGDVGYIKSLSLLDVSRAYPIIMCSYPLFTMIVAVLLLGEHFTVVNGVGAILVLLGIYLLGTRSKQKKLAATQTKINRRGVLLALFGAVMWAVAAAFLKQGSAGMDPFVAASIRIPSATIVLFVLTLSMRQKGTLRLRQYGSQAVAMASAAGILSYGVGGVLLIAAIQSLGAGKAVILSAVSPLLILPMSVFLLKEKVTLRTLQGVLICLPGIYLVAV